MHERKKFGIIWDTRDIILQYFGVPPSGVTL